MLKEYETCARSASHLDTRFWQITSIFAILGAALAGFLAQSGQLTNGVRNDEIIGIGVFGIIVSLVWFSVYWGTFRVQQLTYFRMREIEGDLRMRTSRYIHGVDAPAYLEAHEDLSEEERERLSHFYSCLASRLFRPFGWILIASISRRRPFNWLVNFSPLAWLILLDDPGTQ